MDGADMRDRAIALEQSVRSLSREELARFEDVVREASSSPSPWPPDRRFWFDGPADLKLSRDENNVVRELWTRMNAALVYVVTGEEQDASLDREQIEGRAATVLERALGADVWLGVIGIWNALCADLFGDRLEPSLRSTLVATWRTVKTSGPL